MKAKKESKEETDSGSRLGKLTAPMSSGSARALEDNVGVDVKQTHNRVYVGLFGVGGILWNTISLSNPLKLCSAGQNPEGGGVRHMPDQNNVV